VTIGIFLNPGWFTEKFDEPQKWKAPQGVGSNRSVEYDTLDAKYAEFLEKEILPEVGKIYRLTDDPGEQKDLSAENPEIVQRLTQMLDKMVNDGRSRQ
jgi:hypothetical protein